MCDKDRVIRRFIFSIEVTLLITCNPMKQIKVDKWTCLCWCWSWQWRWTHRALLESCMYHRTVKERDMQQNLKRPGTSGLIDHHSWYFTRIFNNVLEIQSLDLQRKIFQKQTEKENKCSQQENNFRASKLNLSSWINPSQIRADHGTHLSKQRVGIKKWILIRWWEWKPSGLP